MGKAIERVWSIIESGGKQVKHFLFRNGLHLRIKMMESQKLANGCVAAIVSLLRRT
jgi:hypothetical protein